MPGFVTDRRTHNVSVKATITSPSGLVDPWTTVIPGEQVTRSYRSGFRGPSAEEELKQDARIYVPSAKVSSSYDTGHEFYTHDTEYLGTSLPSWGWTHPVYRVRWQGPIVLSAGVDNLSSLIISPMTADSQAVHGARAVKATIPTNSEAGLAQFLGELKRDGIPSLIGSTVLSRDGLHRKFGSEYLNFEFGIKPFVSDIQKLARSVQNSARIVRQLERDSGRIVRRRFTFPPIKSTEHTTVVNNTSGSPLLANVPYNYMEWNSSRSIEITDARTERIWFSGAYTYYCDMGSTLISRFNRYEQLASKLLGARITSGVLWDLAPWSWLSDWFADVGLMLDNASAFQRDGLVIRHGYLMRQTVVNRSVSGTFRLMGDPGHTLVSNSYRTVRKERFKATPYGFGLLHEDFNPRQWAILGALGMTLSPGKMR